MTGVRPAILLGLLPAKRVNSNVVDHFENANGNLFTVRWKIDPGPINTQDITIGVVTNALSPQISTVRLQALLQ